MHLLQQETRTNCRFEMYAIKMI